MTAMAERSLQSTDSRRADGVTLAATLARKLLHTARQLDRCAADLRRRCDRDSVHALRVATRRARALLWSMKPWLRRGRYRAISGRLQDLARRLAPLRDMDVLAEFIPARPAAKAGLDDGQLQQLRVELRHSRARIRRRLVAEIHSGAFRQAVQEIHDQLGAGRMLIRKTAADGSERWRARILRGLARLNRQCRRARRRDLHQIRIHAKRCRYSLEALGPQGLRGPLRRLQAIQNALGRYCDARLAAAWLQSPDSIHDRTLRRRLLRAVRIQKDRRADVVIKVLRAC
jgi:CHAD domain-containing protein